GLLGEFAAQRLFCLVQLSQALSSGSGPGSGTRILPSGSHQVFTYSGNVCGCIGASGHDSLARFFPGVYRRPNELLVVSGPITEPTPTVNYPVISRADHGSGRV